MPLLEMNLRLVGAALLVLGAAHFFIPRHLAWREEAARMSPANCQIFWVHTYFVVLTLWLFGALSLFSAPLLLALSPLARAVLAGFVLFWAFRLYAQHFIFRAELWRGHRRNTAVHVLFTLMWTYFLTVYGAALWSQWSH